MNAALLRAKPNKPHIWFDRRAGMWACGCLGGKGGLVFAHGESWQDAYKTFAKWLYDINRSGFYWEIFP